MKTLAIIGGGAAGLAAAVAAAQDRSALGGARQMRIVLLEAKDQVGRSILATGNGRCNFSNANIDVQLYHESSFVRRCFESLAARQGTPIDAPPPLQVATGALHVGETVLTSPICNASQSPHVPHSSSSMCSNPVLDFFADIGLVWREEGEGRLYPLANKASVVREVLYTTALSEHVEFVCKQMVSAVRRLDAPKEGFTLSFTDASSLHADAVVIAVGGRAIDNLGVPFELVRSKIHLLLGSLQGDTKITKPLNNLRVRCALELIRPSTTAARKALKLDATLRRAARLAAREHMLLEGEAQAPACFVDVRGALLAYERGELLFRDYGVSGIAVFNLSRYARPGDVISIDLLPDVSRHEMYSYLQARYTRLARSGKSLDAQRFIAGLLEPRLGKAVLMQAGQRDTEVFDHRSIAALASVLKGFTVGIGDVADPQHCQVARGGFACEGVAADTLQFRAMPGLYVAGEALDVDGPCGGYNLHFAWASGILAGRSAAGQLMQATPLQSPRLSAQQKPRLLHNYNDNQLISSDIPDKSGDSI